MYMNIYTHTYIYIFIEQATNIDIDSFVNKKKSK